MGELNYQELILQQIRSIDTKELSDVNLDYADTISIKEVEKQKIYFWIRLYLKEECSDIEPGDSIKITYNRSGEFLTTKFIAWGKKNLNRDLDNVIVNYDPEDDKKILCLMVDEDDLTKENSEKIPFIRTLFKTSTFFEFQVYRREDLLFSNERTGEYYEYVDCDF